VRKATAVLFFALIAISVAVMWPTSKWASSVPETGAFCLAAVWCVAFLSGSETPRLSVVMIPSAGIVLWALFQIAAGVTVYPYQTWLSILYWGGNFAALFVSVQIFSDGDLRARFFRWLTLYGFVVSVVAALQALTGSTKIYWYFPTEFAGWNLLGPFVYHNQFAAFIELLLPIVLFNILTEQKWRAFDILIAATMYAAVIVSASRMGSVLVTVELILVPAVLLFRKGVAPKQALVAAGVLIGVVLLLAVSAGPDVLLGKFGLQDPFSIRREYNLSSFSMFKTRPMLGFGLGNWPTAYPAFAIYDNGRYANQAHNDWAQWAVEGGIPLFLVQLWVAIWAFPRAFRTVWGLGVAAIYIHCIVDYPIQRPAGALVFYLVLGALAVQGRVGRRVASERGVLRPGPVLVRA
jgi:O-antigen ligase